MKNLDELRKEINFVDDEILKLFEKRMDIVKEINKIKTELGLPIFVPERETQMKEANCKKLQNADYTNYYLQVLESYLEVSKQFQNELAKK
ncbi:MAG: chorismate mutase [Christensenellales bacterium]|jgi:monofunctional chorismate mutase